MIPSSSGDKFNPLLYVQAFKEEAKEIQSFSKGRFYHHLISQEKMEGQPELTYFNEITDLYSRTVDALLERLLLENVDSNQLLESLTSLNRSYKIIQHDEGKISRIAKNSNILGRSKNIQELKAEAITFTDSTITILERIKARDLEDVSIMMTLFIELCETVGEKLSDAKQSPKKAKLIRNFAAENIKENLEGCIFASRENLIENHSEFNRALKLCAEIAEKLTKAGWKEEASMLRNVIAHEFKEIEREPFYVLHREAHAKLLDIARDKEETDIVNKMSGVVGEFIRNQQTGLVLDRDISTEAYTLCNSAIALLRASGKNEEATLLRSLLCSEIRESAEKYILSKNEEIVENRIIALQTLEFCTNVAQNLIQMGEAEIAHSLQFFMANIMKESAVKFLFNNEKQILEDPKMITRAYQLCSMATSLLIKVGLNKEALAIQSLTNKFSFEEQEIVEEFFRNNREKIAQDLSTTIQAHEFCDKAAQHFLEMDLVDKALDILAIAAKEIPVPYPQTHPLYDLTGVFQQLQSRKQDSELGARFSGLDTGILKGGTICIKERNIENNMTACLDFTISLLRRESMGKYIEGIQANPERFNHSLPPGLCEGIVIREIPEYTFKSADEDKVFSDKKGLSLNAGAIEIEFEGLGKVIVGKNSQCLGLYNAISIELKRYQEPEEALQKLNQMVTLLGLGPIFQLQRPEDDERMKMGQLFKAYYPAKSYELERTTTFYELPVEQLRRKMIDEEKGMENIFKKYLEDHPELMVKEEIYPGEIVWTVRDLSIQLKEKGAMGFVAKLNGNWEGKIAIEKLKSIIKNGMLSSMERFQANMMTPGWSSTTDIALGSGREVFSRMVTKNNISNHKIIETGCYVLFDLDIVNRVTYGWGEDCYGSKAGLEYRERENLMDLLDYNPDLSEGNEHMSKKRIQPEKLRLLLSKSLKESLIEELSKDGLIEEFDGKKYIKLDNKSVPVDEMILEIKENLMPEMF